MSVTPSQLHAVGEQLARHPETAFIGAVTGPANLFVSVLCTGLDQLYLYLYVTTTLGAIPAIQVVETSLVLGSIKQAGSLVRGRTLVASR
jgi:Lrp/AsnC ligand binding domain